MLPNFKMIFYKRITLKIQKTHKAKMLKMKQTSKLDLLLKSFTELKRDSVLKLTSSMP